MSGAAEAQRAAATLRAVLAMVRHGEMDAPTGTIRALEVAVLTLDALSGDNRRTR